MGGYDESDMKLMPLSHLPLAEWDSFFSVLELFPIPVEVFSPEGLSLFVNKEFLNIFRLDDADEIVGKFNVLSDPYINDTMELTNHLRQVFSGTASSLHDVRFPSEEFSGRYAHGSTTFLDHDRYFDIISLPLLEKDSSIICVVTMFMLKHVYQSRLDALKVKAYIETHWLDDFDRNRIADAADLSPDHLARIFKKFTGETPYSYYREVKLERIKEKLRDPALSVSEAFVACGADYSSCFADVFKQKVGMTPGQYKKHLSLFPQETSPCPEQPKARGKYPRFSPSYPSIPVCKTANRLFRVAELLPLPIQIFRQNGDMIFANEAVLEVWDVHDLSWLLGKYNIITGPLVTEQPRLREKIRKAFQGEVVLITDVRIPLERFWESLTIKNIDRDIEVIYTDILNFTVWVEDRRTHYVVSVFLTNRLYRGKLDIAKAMEYLEDHWKEEFDIYRLAQAIGLSPSHLARLFKKHTGMTLYSYYQDIKIHRLKDALRDRNLSIAEAFDSCGLKYSGNLAGLFKKKTGFTPSQYRKSLGR